MGRELVGQAKHRVPAAGAWIRLLVTSLALLVLISVWLVLASPATAASLGPAVSGTWDLSPLAGGRILDMDGARVLLSQSEMSGQTVTSHLLLYDVSSQTSQSFDVPAGPLVADLKGDHVAFSAHDGESLSVWLLTLSTKDLQKIATDQRSLSADQPIILTGHQVIWSERTATGSVLESYDLASGELRILVDDEAYGSPYIIAASGSWLVYETWKEGEKKPRHWAIDLETGATSEISTETYYYPTLDGDLLYYVPGTSEQNNYGPLPELHRLDLTTMTDSLVASGTEYQNLQADGNHLAWASWANGAAYVAVRDLATGSETHVPMPAYAVGGLRLAGDTLLFQAEARISYRASMEGNYLFAFDISGGTLTRLSGDIRYPQMWYTDGSSVVYPRMIWQTQSAGATAATRRVPAPTAFSDVSGLDPYFTAIMGMKLLGAAEGYAREGGGVDFRPQALLTRAQFAKMLAEVLDLEVTEEATAPFVDLGPDDPSNLFPHDYVAALLAFGGIVKGTSPDHFSPDAVLTRAQLVTFIERAAVKLLPGVLEGSYTLMDPTLGNFDPLHGPTLALAERGGLLDGLVGYSPIWDPWQAATRAEAAQMLWNLAEMTGQN